MKIQFGIYNGTLEILKVELEGNKELIDAINLCIVDICNQNEFKIR